MNKIGTRCIIGTLDSIKDLADAAALQLVGALDASRLLRTQPWRRIIAENTPSADLDGLPVFVAQGTADDIVPPDLTRDLVARLCRQAPPCASIGSTEATTPTPPSTRRGRRFAGSRGGSWPMRRPRIPGLVI